MTKQGPEQATDAAQTTTGQLSRGIDETLGPDGSLRRALGYADGTTGEETMQPDGTTQRTLKRPDGVLIEETRLRDGSSATRTSGRADGTIVERAELPDGSTEVVRLKSDGSSIIEIYDAETDTLTVVEDEATRNSRSVQSSRSRFRVVSATPVA